MFTKGSQFYSKIINYGADMKKHLYFRQGDKNFTEKNGVDLAIIAR